MTHAVHCDNFASAWFELLRRLHTYGLPVAPRGQETHELVGIQLRVNDMSKNILVHPARNLSYRFMIAEWLWMAAGRNDVASITKYNKRIAEFSDDGRTFAGAYGPRLLPQIPWILEQLTKPGSRQAVVQIWTPCPLPSRDIPCTLNWQLIARNGALHAVVNMRSSDVHLGLPYDFFNFSQMTSSIAGTLGLDRGAMTFNLGSSHLYDCDRDVASRVLAAPDAIECIGSPPLPEWPPSTILDSTDALKPPWDAYRNVLDAPTNAAALEALRGIKA